MNKLFYLMILLSINFSMLIAHTASDSLNKETITISGKIAIDQKDENGKVIRVGIVFNNQEEELWFYFIDNEGKGKKLLNKEGKTAEITGTVYQDKDGTEFIKVKKFKIIKDDKLKTPEK